MEDPSDNEEQQVFRSLQVQGPIAGRPLVSTISLNLGEVKHTKGDEMFVSPFDKIKLDDAILIRENRRQIPSQSHARQMRSASSDDESLLTGSPIFFAESYSPAEKRLVQILFQQSTLTIGMTFTGNLTTCLQTMLNEE